MVKTKSKSKARRSAVRPQGFKGHVPAKARANFIRQFRAHLLNKTMSRFRSGSI